MSISLSRPLHTFANIARMANKAPLSYSAALKGNHKEESFSSPSPPISSNDTTSTVQPNQATSQSRPAQKSSPATNNNHPLQNQPHRKPANHNADRKDDNNYSKPSTQSNHNRNHSPQTRNPAYRANTTASHEISYILSLLTSSAHQTNMTALRKKYFPPKLNKLGAHIAVFRALPGSELPRINEDIADLVSRTAPFVLVASNEPFRLRQGVGINVTDGQRESRKVYEELRGKWKRFLSKQDDGGFKAHYTVMNKVDDEKEVERAMEEIGREWKGDEGVCEGLIMWRYDRGYWKLEKEFKFEGK